MARRLRIEPYDPNAVDGDGDGIVQENTAWERPVGTRLIDEFGNEIRQGLMSTQRPARMRVVDRNGNDVRYLPTYLTQAERQREITPTPLGLVGAPSLAETGRTPIPTLADRGLQTVGERLDDVDAIVNPQTVEAPDGIEQVVPTPQMLANLPSSSPDVEINELRDPLLFGALMILSAQSNPEMLDALRTEWDSSTIDYFEYHTNVRLSFDEYMDLLVDLQMGRDLPQIQTVNGEPADPQIVAYGLSMASASQIRLQSDIRPMLKERVALSIADQMSRNYLDEKATEELIDVLLMDSGYFYDIGSRGTDDAVYLFQLYEDAFPGGRIKLTQNEVRDLYRWGLGGDRPLWLDDIRTPDEYKIIFGSGVQLLRKNVDEINPDIIPVPIALMPTFDSDSPDILRAKQKAQELIEQIYRPPGELRETFYSVSDIYRLAQDEVDTHCSISIAREVSNSLLEKVVKRDDLGVTQRLAIGEILDDRDIPDNDYRNLTYEERLLILAGSGLLDESLMTDLKVLISGPTGLWDFTEQDGWDEFADRISQARLPKERADIVRDPISLSLQIVERDSAFRFKGNDGKPIPFLPSSDWERRSDALSRAISSELSDYDSDTVDSLQDIASRLKSLSEEDSDRQIDTLFSLIEELHEALDETDDRFDGLIIRDELLSMLEDISIDDDKISEDRYLIALDNPSFDSLQGIIPSYIQQWAVTSNGVEPLSYVFQEITQELFNLDPELVVAMEDVFPDYPGAPRASDVQLQVDKILKKRRNLAQAFIKAQYASTQEFLAGLGIQSIPVSRAMSLAPDDETIQVLEGLDNVGPNPPYIEAISPLRPLSSFASYLPILSEFAKAEPNSVVITSRVPSHQILSLPFTGFGCFNEHEVVVIGQPLYVRIIQAQTIRERDLFDPPVVSDLQ